MRIRSALFLVLIALPAAGQQPAREQQAPPRAARQQPAPAPAQPAPAPTPAPAAEPSKGSETGLPLPRFASLRSNDVNLRVGPGTEYPATWTYRRRNLPVEIVAEFRTWRQIRDMEGVTGWVHAATLVGKRSFVVTGPEVMLRRRPEPDAAPVARLMSGVVGQVLACPERLPWCEAKVGDHRGWLPRAGIWGVGPQEVVGG
jgi:SH3-like domain-containing protein